MYKIMVVEDDDCVKENLEIFFRSENYYTVSASNGMEALIILESFSPDLIISELNMPYVNGIELFERVKSNYPDHHIQFIFLIAKGDASSVHSGLNTIADCYIAKPFELGTLLKAVKTQQLK